MGTAKTCNSERARAKAISKSDKKKREEPYCVETNEEVGRGWFDQKAHWGMEQGDDTVSLAELPGAAGVLQEI